MVFFFSTLPKPLYIMGSFTHSLMVGAVMQGSRLPIRILLSENRTSDPSVVGQRLDVTKWFPHAGWMVMPCQMSALGWWHTTARSTSTTSVLHCPAHACWSSQRQKSYSFLWGRGFWCPSKTVWTVLTGIIASSEFCKITTSESWVIVWHFSRQCHHAVGDPQGDWNLKQDLDLVLQIKVTNPCFISPPSCRMTVLLKCAHMFVCRLHAACCSLSLGLVQRVMILVASPWSCLSKLGSPYCRSEVTAHTSISNVYHSTFIRSYLTLIVFRSWVVLVSCWSFMLHPWQRWDTQADPQGSLAPTNQRYTHIQREMERDHLFPLFHPKWGNLNIAGTAAQWKQSTECN